MKITLTDDAITWYENKIPLDEGEAIRFFGKTYGSTNVHDGFSLGIQVDNPEQHESIIGLTEKNGRKYFTTKQDEWFFEGYDLEVSINEKLDEPHYYFSSQDPNAQDNEADSISGASEKE